MVMKAYRVSVILAIDDAGGDNPVEVAKEQIGLELIDLKAEDVSDTREGKAAIENYNKMMDMIDLRSKE